MKIFQLLFAALHLSFRSTFQCALIVYTNPYQICICLYFGQDAFGWLVFERQGMRQEVCRIRAGSFVPS